MGVCSLTGKKSIAPLTAEARLQFRASPCEICDGQGDTGTGFSPHALVFLFQLLHQCCTFLFICIPLVPERQTSEAWGTF